MSAPSNQQLVKLIQSMIVERQRLLIREANFLRGLVGLPPVRAENDGPEKWTIDAPRNRNGKGKGR